MRKAKQEAQTPFLTILNKVVESISNIDIAYAAKQMVSKNAAVMTHGKTSWRVLDNIGKKHKAVLVKDKKEVSKIFPWVHIAINLKKKS